LRLPLPNDRELNALWKAAAGFDLDFSSLQGQFDVFRALKRVMTDRGFKAFMVLRLPRDAAEASVSCLSIISSWPADMITRYDQLGVLRTSSVMRRLMASVLPFRFDVEAAPQVEQIEQAVEAARMLFVEFGLSRGVCLPVHDANGARGVVIFSGTRPPLEDDEVLQLQMVAALVFERLIQLQYVDERPGEALSDREIDCLLWTSAGKTSAEISEILGLSEHTVNHYLNRAAKKLGTVNRTQAVAKALRIGIIK
jgi:LuxR family transcriptional regulator, quorum-sensing system regulator BjaR1